MFSSSNPVWQILLRYRASLLMTLALALPLGSMYYHGKVREETSVVEKSLLLLTAPAERATQSVFDAVSGLIDDYVTLIGVNRDNDRLRTDNQMLLGEALKSRSMRDELGRLKELCGFREQRQELTTLPARVVGRDVSQFFRVLRLRLEVAGAQGVAEGQAVVTHDGVVGRIERVAGDYADVMLVTDSRSQIHGSISGKGVVGTIRGKGRRNEFGARFVYLERADQAAPIAPGDAVLTTGHDRVFPAGLEIGHITPVAGTRSGLYHEFSLTPAVVFATLEEVLIVTSYSTPNRDLPAPKAARASPRRVDPANTPDDQ